MSVQAAKRAVTSYFRGRGAVLRLLNNRRLSQSSDYFELYVLVRLTKLGGGTPVPTGRDSRQRPVFLVAGAPSPSWRKASYVRVRGLAARTGLQVQCSPGSVELDVALVDPTLVNTDLDTVPAGAAMAAFECKALSGKLKTTHANEILGKAHRVWTLPVPQLQRGTATAARYSAVALNGATAGLDQVLSVHGVGLADNLVRIDAQVLEVLEALP